MDTFTRLEIEKTKNGFQVCGPKKKQILNSRKLFQLGFYQFEVSKPAAAGDAFSALVDEPLIQNDSKIMLAICAAELDRYETCETNLADACNERHDLAKTLQNAFVFLSLGMRADALKELVKVVNDKPPYGSIPLICGELMLQQNQRKHAVKCFQLAVKLDKHGGVRAVVSRKMQQIGLANKSQKQGSKHKKSG